MADQNDGDITNVLVVKLLKVQGRIKSLTTQHYDDMSDVDWLTRMASLRKELATIYLMASNDHGHDSIEFHALRELSFIHERYAADNLSAARNHQTTTDGVA